ncbi:unnamed protein product [Ceutorhynchus assimilis]|uniref:Uncharacterized protein n=1 Tax=Ceutorhynchus assimilis TaxID=467358 RepID=A0A9N9MT04_9CUCU|nr:unnamed protein product [Ceutorhynchus assimilis]
MRHFAKDLYPDDQKTATQNKPRDFCEVVHIGVVCSGFTSNVYFHVLLKSLLMSRANPIHFHLLVSDESDTVLRWLFKTWQLPQVNITFYNMNLWLKDVRWVPNGHYSGNYGLLKLIFNRIVPSNVTTKLLILDTDLLVNDDIFNLWKHFDNFNYKQVIGIGENQSPYYLGQSNKANPWPAIGTGFNSGVMLYNLERLNSMNWDAVWVNLTKRFTLIYGQVNLGDQDIINSAIMENPDILYQLPCYWNTQMSGQSTSSNCYSKYKPKIVHWNSPQKYSVATKDGDMFRGFANSFFELNGDWFRSYPRLCDNGNQIPNIYDSTEDCATFTKPPGLFYRTHLFFLEYKFIADEWDISYVTHLSYDRAHRMESIAKIWTGPISFTLYVSDAEWTNIIRIITDSEVLSSRTDIAYHAVFKQGKFYPINTLRNTGLNHIKTPYSFLIDIDFTPMRSLFEILKENIKSIGDLKKKALIVPAFEAKEPNIGLPKSKIELLKLVAKNEIKPFLADTWSVGHAPTNYEKWKTEYQPYQVKWQPHYEPYIVVKSNVVQYDERFLGFGWNKVSHIMELEAQNYEFIVLSDVFILHETHAMSNDNLNYKRMPLYRKCIQTLKRRLVQGLSKKYNKTFTDINFFDEYKRKRRKRNLAGESTTTLYDSTDYFLAWGGKEKAERKKEPRKRITNTNSSNNKEVSSNSKESDKSVAVEYDYYYYDSIHPYNLTILKRNETKHKFQRKINNLTLSSEEHDYEYDDDDVKFRDLHDSTTSAGFNDSFTIFVDEIEEKLS